MLPSPVSDEPPAIIQIYRDRIRPGAEAAFSAVERRAARVCAELGCPHPHLAVESLSDSREVWWLNFYASEQERAEVAAAYASNGRLMDALAQITTDKQDLTDAPGELFVHYRADSSRGTPWKVAGSRYLVAAITTGASPPSGAVYEALDGRWFTLIFVRSQREADALCWQMGALAQVLAIRPDLGFPAVEWRAADPEFWRDHPATRDREGAAGGPTAGAP